MIHTSIEDTLGDNGVWTASINSGGVVIPYKLDTGAQISVLPYEVYRHIPNKSKSF